MTVAGFGAYGKTPSLGDFFRVNVPKGFVDPWDRWLQTVLAANRKALGAQWDDCYLMAPIWRFTLPAGLAGPAAVMGVLMPSVDRVGRQFPLTLVAALSDQTLAPEHGALFELFLDLEDIALDTLDGTDTTQSLGQNLAELTVPKELGPVDPVTGQLGHWSAQVEDTLLRFDSPTLMSAEQARILFDPPQVAPRADPLEGLVP